jgi:hypothetical protein
MSPIKSEALVKWPKGAAVALYYGAPFHVFEPCPCGLHCHAVMVHGIHDDHPVPWPIHVGHLEPVTTLAHELIVMAAQ